MKTRSTIKSILGAALAIMLLAVGGNAQAQTWSDWQASTGEVNILYRTMVYADTSSESGYTLEWEISNQHSVPCNFNLIFEIPILNPSDQQYVIEEESMVMNLSANTTAVGALDTQLLQAVRVENCILLTDAVDPEDEESDHMVSEPEGQEDVNENP